VGPWAGLDRCGKFAPIGIRSPDRRTRSQSQYRLSYPAHNRMNAPDEFLAAGGIRTYIASLYSKIRRKSLEEELSFLLTL